MTDKINFYQIQLFKKGEVEIFQNVFSHKIHVVNGETKGIELRYGKDGPGSCTNSMRPMDGVYEVKKIEEPVYQFFQFPQDIKVTIDGKHVFTPKNSERKLSEVKHG